MIRVVGLCLVVGIVAMALPWLVFGAWWPLWVFVVLVPVEVLRSLAGLLG